MLQDTVKSLESEIERQQNQDGGDRCEAAFPGHGQNFGEASDGA